MNNGYSRDAEGKKLFSFFRMNTEELTRSEEETLKNVDSASVATACTIMSNAATRVFVPMCDYFRSHPWKCQKLSLRHIMPA